MEKDYDEEVEEIDDDDYEEPTEEEKEQREIEKEQGTQVRKGQVEFKKVNHSERAETLKRVSDGDTTKYVNIALEYFGHRCALSGERFTKFDGKVQKTSAKSNLSAEHIVALCLGGDDIVPNLVPTVLQYNLKKNGYYLLDYWDKQKDIEGKSLYSPYRLLKLVNYMMKSIEARKSIEWKDVKQYRKAIMTPNEIDEFLEEIEKQDELETDNSKKKIHSDTITATTVDEDNKKILTEVPQVEGNIPTQREQLERFRQNEIDMMDIFLSDAVGLLNRTQELQQIQLKDKEGNEISLKDKLFDMLKSTIGVIPFEVEVRNAILEKLESLGVQDNKYSVANDLLNNTPILETAKENRDNIKLIVKDYIENQLTRIRENKVLSEEQLKIVISSMPTVLYDEKEMNKIKLWSTYRSDSFKELISGNYTSTDRFVEVLIILKKNGIDFVYEDEKGKIVNTIKSGDTIDIMLERYPKLTEEQKSKIIAELEELGINRNIGKTLHNQKNANNKEKFEKALMELRTKLRQEGIKMTEDEWNSLTQRQMSQNQTEDMINTIEVLKRNGINLLYEDGKGKIVNTIQSGDTIDIMLERYPKLTEEQKNKIIAELEELGVNSNIGNSLYRQKNAKHKEKFEKALMVLRTKLRQEGIEITEDEWDSLTQRQLSQNATEDMMNTIEVLKRNGIKLAYEDEKGKIVNTIQSEDTIDIMLERYPKLTKEQKNKIIAELEELGINHNIGASLNTQKNANNKEKFEKALMELRTKLRQEGIEMTEDEWKSLIQRQRSQNATEDMVNTIEVLKRNGINLVYENEKGKIVNTIQNRDTIEIMLERYPKLTKEQKNKIIAELEELGINPNIGRSLNDQKNAKNKEKFKKALMELRTKLRQDGIELTEDEWKNITERQMSQNPTEDMVNTIEVLKRNGIKLAYEDEKGKIVNTIQSEDTIDIMLERYPKLTKEQKNKIIAELEELGINPNIGISLNTQKNANNKEKFEKALMELRTKLRQEGIEMTEDEWKFLTKKQKRSENQTEDMVNTIEVLKRNGINLVYENEKGKIVNTIQNRDTIEIMLERYPKLTKEQKNKIIAELEELGINHNIGTSLQTQKNEKNKEKFETALMELRAKLRQEGMELTEDEWKCLTEKRTQKKIKQTVVEQKNKGELGQNQQIEEDVFEETIRQAEQTQEAETSAR